MALPTLPVHNLHIRITPPPFPQHAQLTILLSIKTHTYLGSLRPEFYVTYDADLPNFQEIYITSDIYLGNMTRYMSSFFAYILRQKCQFPTLRLLRCSSLGWWREARPKYTCESTHTRFPRAVALGLHCGVSPYADSARAMRPLNDVSDKDKVWRNGNSKMADATRKRANAMRHRPNQRPDRK